MCDVSVLIPTRGRPESLRRCLGGLASQTMARERFEVLIGVDGEDEGEGSIAAESGLRARVFPGDHAGPAATRNRLLQHASAPLLLLLNDDVVPTAELLECHADAHCSLGGGTAMVLGSAPWAVRNPDTLFDRLVRETSMVFFYDRMTGPQVLDLNHDWGFRHAWTLNLSLPASALREVGGFCESLPGAAYEDIEMAWRVRERFGAPVLYRPGASVVHEHWYTPEGYLRRERSLGRDAVALARAAPGCAQALFARDITSEDEVAYSRSVVRRESSAAARAAERLASFASMPSDAVSGRYAPELIDALYQQHLAAKRWQWRLGLLEGLGEPTPEGD